MPFLGGNMKVNVLGTKYKIETHKVSEDDILKNSKFSGYCSDDSKLIVIADLEDDEYFNAMSKEEKCRYRKLIMRHEITHAFLSESGLRESTNKPGVGWAKNEEMVDWIAIQFPKLIKAFQEVGCL